MRGNTVRDNAAACPATDDVPASLSAIGITLIGAGHVQVSGNTVSGNRPTGDTPVAGGIALVSAKSFGGPDPVGDSVTGNHAHANAPADVVYDGTGRGNHVAANDCDASLPNGLR